MNITLIFLVKVRSGKILAIETKGEQYRGTPDTNYKRSVGSVWSDIAGKKFAYFMVFKNEGDTGGHKNVLCMEKMIDVLKLII